MLNSREAKYVSSASRMLKAQRVAQRVSQQITEGVLSLLPASLRSAMLLLIALWVKQDSRFNYSFQEHRAELLVLLHLLLHGMRKFAKHSI